MMFKNIDQLLKSYFGVHHKSTSPDITSVRPVYPGLAVMIIDMTPKHFYVLDKDVQSYLLDCHRRLIEQCSTDNIPIVLVKPAICPYSIRPIRKALKTVDSVKKFDKMTLSALGSEKIERYLRSNNIDELFITGLFSDQCPYETGKDAVLKGFKVSSSMDVLGECNGRQSYSRPRDAEKIRENYSSAGIRMYDSLDLFLDNLSSK